VNDFRMKIAAAALVLGLGGLGGYAISSSRAPQAAAGAPAEGTKVIRRTVHPKARKAAGPPVGAARNTLASSSAPVSTGSSGSSSSSGSSGAGPVRTGSSGSSGGGGSRRPPVSTGSSGGGGGERGEREGGDD
jgi:hypothetical protein